MERISIKQPLETSPAGQQRDVRLVTAAGSARHVLHTLSRRDSAESRGILHHFATAHLSILLCVSVERAGSRFSMFPFCLLNTSERAHTAFLFFYIQLSQVHPAKTTDRVALYICSFWLVLCRAAECEWQAAESQSWCEHCVKGQGHDGKSLPDGGASLFKVGPSLPSGIAADSVPMMCHVNCSLNQFQRLPYHREGKKKIWLL